MLILKDWKIVHEVKKSRKWMKRQNGTKILYVVLKNKGVEIEKGILDYPFKEKRGNILR